MPRTLKKLEEQLTTANEKIERQQEYIESLEKRVKEAEQQSEANGARANKLKETLLLTIKDM